MVGLRFSKDNSNSDFTSFSSVVSSFVVWGITFSWLSLLISGFSKSEIMTRVRAALDKVGLLEKESFNPLTLSGGEQQRLCIARAVVNKPAILLADEPTGNLDPGYAADIVAMFRAFNRVGVTVVIATHDPAMIQGLGARIIELKQGELQA